MKNNKEMDPDSAFHETLNGKVEKLTKVNKVEKRRKHVKTGKAQKPPQGDLHPLCFKGPL